MDNPNQDKRAPTSSSTPANNTRSQTTRSKPMVRRAHRRLREALTAADPGFTP